MSALPEQEPPPSYTEATGSVPPQSLASVAAEGSKPRCTLASQLSKSDQDAIAELRQQLGGIVNEAYGPKRTGAAATIWGVVLDPSQPSAKTDIVLHKFLKARKMKVSEARDRLIATLRWREEMNIPEIMQEVFPEHVFGPLGAIFGHDKEGRPVTYSLYGNVLDPKAVFSDPQRYIRWRIQFLERSIALLDFDTVDQMIQVHDYARISDAFNTPEAWEASSLEKKMLEEHYSMFVFQMFMVGLPTWMVWGTRLFRFLRPSNEFSTTTTVVRGGPSAIGKELEQVIERSQIPVLYDGEAKGFVGYIEASIRSSSSEYPVEKKDAVA